MKSSSVDHAVCPACEGVQNRILAGGCHFESHSGGGLVVVVVARRSHSIQGAAAVLHQRATGSVAFAAVGGQGVDQLELPGGTDLDDGAGLVANAGRFECSWRPLQEKRRASGRNSRRLRLHDRGRVAAICADVRGGGNRKGVDGESHRPRSRAYKLPPRW